MCAGVPAAHSQVGTSTINTQNELSLMFVKAHAQIQTGKITVNSDGQRDEWRAKTEYVRKKEKVC